MIAADVEKTNPIASGTLGNHEPITGENELRPTTNHTGTDQTPITNEPAAAYEISNTSSSLNASQMAPPNVAGFNSKPSSHKTESVQSETKSEASIPEEGKKPSKRRKKVNSACVYCRRSHMICDDSRPCKRCVKRGIGNMCHDESSSKHSKHTLSALNPTLKSPVNSLTDSHLFNIPSSATLNQQPFFYSEHAGSEFNSLTEFLSMIDDNDMMDSINLNNDPMLQKLEANNYFNNFTSSTNLQNLLNNASNSNSQSHSQSQSHSNDNANARSSLNLDMNGITAKQPTDLNLSSNLQHQEVSFLPHPMNAQQSQPQLQPQPQSQPQLQSQPQSQPQNSSRHLLQPPAPTHHQNQHQHEHQHEHQQPKQPVSNGNQQQLNYDSSYNQHHHPHHHRNDSLLQFDPNNSSYKRTAPLQQNTQTVQVAQQAVAGYYPKSPTLQRSTAATAAAAPAPHISDAARDKFFLTAADPTTEISPEERLKQVINAKLEAGLLKPYNYAKGYQRLQTYMDKYMSSFSRSRILKPLSRFRPGFRAIAKTLKDIDLILVEENFERMLLDYDRVFTSMAIPACLWRRTGEIYRGNKEFASLVEVSIEDLKNGKLTIYELMTEESSVNFWEKYGSIAFDKTQKAVLTSCNLRTKDGRKKKNCCFSFTIRRDRYNIPSCIVGNFIPIR